MYSLNCILSPKPFKVKAERLFFNVFYENNNVLIINLKHYNCVFGMTLNLTFYLSLQKLNSPTLSVNSDGFIPMLSKLDDCIEYVSSHVSSSHSRLNFNSVCANVILLPAIEKLNTR